MKKDNQAKKFYVIYKTTNIINDKFYIGMHITKNINDKYMGSGKVLIRSIKKYGKENFKVEIIEYLSNKSELLKRERDIINIELLKDKKCMNIRIGGRGGFTKKEAKIGRVKTDKILLEKYGINFRQIITSNYFNSLSEQEKKERSDNIKKGQNRINFNHATFLNKKHKKETKIKIGLITSELKGEKNSQYNTCWIFNNEYKINKKIKKEELNNWIVLGWRLGRKMKF